MSRSEQTGRPGGERSSAAPTGRARPGSPETGRYGRYVGVLAVVILALITLNTVLTHSHGAMGLPVGTAMPPFAVPLATGDLPGEANVATRPNQGDAGRTPACQVRGSEILNLCQLYERGPVVLALFVDAGGCQGILDDLQKLAPSFPGVSFAAVSLKGHREKLRALVSAHHLSLPVGLDRDGALAALYRVSSCPQITFGYPGGKVQSRALLVRPSLATLRARVSSLVAAARARGWHGPQ
jgi:hypothetical protein